MNTSKKLIILIVLLSIVSFGGSYAMAMQSKSKTPANQSSQHANHASTTGTIKNDPSIANAKPALQLDLARAAKEPTEVYVKVGDIIQFNASGDASHRIAMGQGGTEHEHTSGTDSGDFSTGEAWRVRLDKTGTYFFHDHFNPAINILVVVYEQGKQYKISGLLSANQASHDSNRHSH